MRHALPQALSPKSSVGLLALCCAWFASSPAAQLRLPSIVGDGMVLQRRSEVPIWGWSAPGSRVEVAADWPDAAVVHAPAGADGAWSVRLRTPDAGGPYTVTITSGETRMLRNVLVGEVWLCSGQSNMEMAVANIGPSYGGVAGAEAAIAAADQPLIRLFTVQNAIAAAPQVDCTGEWVPCSPATVRRFSATGYFFGRALQAELGVPIGLISADWGGTLIEAWTSERSLRSLSEFAPALDQLAAERERPAETEAMRAAALEAYWQRVDAIDPGTAGGWATPAFDDSSWQSMVAPAAWSDADLGSFDGIAWFRRTVELPDAWRGRDLVLELGPIDDLDVTWINGQQVGATLDAGKWQTPRRYVVPAAAVRTGTNVIAVRVHDTGGGGGMIGEPAQMKVSSDVEGVEPIALAGTWRFQRGPPQQDLPAPPPQQQQTVHVHAPTALFNGMIAPIVPFGIRGVIWYQGESNRGRAAQYRALLPALIADWRAHWGRGELPFYFVQIAPFAYGGDTGQAAELREAQMRTLAVPGTGMAVTMDIGNPRDIHPKNKQAVGRRLALWALARTYGQTDLCYSGPLYRSKRVEGDAIRLSFDHVGSGLTSDGQPLTHFMIAGEDRQFVPAEAVIEDDTIVVRSAGVPAPVAVRFAWGAADEPNLKNVEGLPASSFRTDDWPMVSASK